MAQINKPNLHYNTKLYTGTGSSLSVTGVGFQPDWVWIKERNGTTNHFLHDAVRGVTKAIFSNLTSAEDTGAQYLTAFNADGFTVGTNGGINTNGDTYASWNWKANGAGSANSDGSVASTVSANTTAGFSIVKWTGTGATATVGHGLGVKPSIVLIKNTGAVENWVMYHSSLTAEKNLKLNNSEAAQDTTGAFNDTEPTSSVFTVHTNTNTNQNGQVMIAYCFAEKKGYSKFGSYTGNGNTDGPFIYTGFRPAFVLQRQTDDSRDWTLIDGKRAVSNVMDKRLVPNDNNVEATNNDTDFLSNGFKCRRDQTNTNGNGSNYIYLAFAENPLVGTNNVVGTAR